MKTKKYRIKGHESFILRDGWITKGVNAVSLDNRFYRINSGADALGVGTNMAKSIRYWLRTSGITSESPTKGVFLTPFGEVLQKNDIYTEDIFTMWIIHTNIATNFENATSWYLFFNSMNLFSSFNREEMISMMKTLLMESTGDDGFSDRSIRDDCAAILMMYGKSGNPNDDPEDKRKSPFEELGLLARSGNGYIKKRPALDRLDELVILYLIIDKLNEEGSLPIDLLADGENMPGKILNLNRIIINDYLDKLQNGGYIQVNRTAGLDIIYPDECKAMKKIDVITKYYDGRKQQ